MTSKIWIWLFCVLRYSSGIRQGLFSEHALTEGNVFNGRSKLRNWYQSFIKRTKIDTSEPVASSTKSDELESEKKHSEFVLPNIPSFSELLTWFQSVRPPVSPKDVSIVTSKNDKQQYQVFDLDNGLRGVGITDENSDESAFAVTVGCGYNHDPKEFPGLAHILEHMIFRGTVPDNSPTSWHEFVITRAGSFNAITSDRTMTFYVAGPTEHIDSLMTRLKQQLLNPLFDENQYQYEVNMIHDEFLKDSGNIKTLLEYVARSLISTESQNHFFGGNYKSLCKDPAETIKLMKMFHSHCFIPKNMAISLKIGSKDLNSKKCSPCEPRSMVFKIFDSFEVEKRDRFKVFVTDDPDMLFRSVPEMSGPRLYKMRHNDLENIDKYTFFYWTLPSGLELMNDEAEWQPLSFIRWVFSAVETALNTDWVHSVEYVEDVTYDAVLVGFFCHLAPKGASNWNELFSKVTEHVERIKMLFLDKQKGLEIINNFYNQLTNTSQLLFDYSTPLTDEETVLLTSRNALLFRFSPSLVRAAGSIISINFNDGLPSMYQDRLYEILKSFTIKNFSGIVLSNEFQLVEKVFLPFLDYAYSSEILQLKNNKESDKLDVSALLKVENCKVKGWYVVINVPEFECLDFKGSDFNKTEEQFINQTGHYPCLLQKDDFSSIYWKNVDPFNEPLVRAMFKWRFKDENFTPQVVLYNLVDIEVRKFYLVSLFAGYKQCGLEYSVISDNGAVVIEIKVLSTLFSDVISKLTEAFRGNRTNTEATFQLALLRLQDALSDYTRNTAFSFAHKVLNGALRKYQFSPNVLEDELNKNPLTYSNYIKNINDRTTHAYFDAYIFGNISAKEAKEVATMFRTNVITSPIRYEDSVKTAVVNPEKNLLIVVKEPIPNDPSNVVVNFFPIGIPTDALTAKIYSVIGRLFSNRFIEQIRFLKEDGYVAYAGIMEAYPIYGLYTVIQGSARSSDNLAFDSCVALESIKTTIEGLLKHDKLAEEIENHTASILSDKRVNSSAKYWKESSSLVSNHSYCFETLYWVNAKVCAASVKKHLKEMFPANNVISVKVFGSHNTGDETKVCGPAVMKSNTEHKTEKWNNKFCPTTTVVEGILNLRNFLTDKYRMHNPDEAQCRERNKSDAELC